MATARYICNTALRKLGRLGAGREPRLADQTDVLDALRSLYRGWIASGAFGRLIDVVPVADYTARENERIFRTNGDTLTITLPQLVPNWPLWWPYRYGDLWQPPTVNQTDQNVRPPRNGAVIVIVDDTTGADETFIYDGAIRCWTPIDDFGLDDEAPMSKSDPDGLSSCLALSVSDQFGAEVSQATGKASQRYAMAMTNNYSYQRRISAGSYF